LHTLALAFCLGSCTAPTSGCSTDEWFATVILEGLRGGFFLDVSGTACSRSIFLEKELGWGGLCVQQTSGIQLQGSGRSCTVVNATSATSSQVVHKYDVPKVVDYMSLGGNERESLSFLRPFPFSSHEVRVLTVRRRLECLDTKDPDSVNALLVSKNYTKVATNSVTLGGRESGGACEDLYVHQTHLEVLALNNPGIRDELTSVLWPCCWPRRKPNCMSREDSRKGGAGADVHCDSAMPPPEQPSLVCEARRPRSAECDAQSYSCKRYGDLTQYCTHANSLCFVGGSLRVLSAAQSGPVPTADVLSDRFLHFDADPFFTSPFPFRAMLPPARFMHPRRVEELRVEWLEGMSAVTGVDSAQYNLYHFASHILLLFGYRQREGPDYHAILESNATPFTRALIFGRRSDWTDWQRNIMWIATGLSESDVTFDDTHSGLGNVCFREAVVGGQTLTLFQGPFDAQIWRRIIEQSYGVVLERRDVVIFRREHSRVLVNADDVRSLTQRVFGEERVREVSFWQEVPFVKQLETMSKAAVLISTHGSNSNHAIYMPAGGVVIEIVGVKADYLLAERISLSSGVFHFRHTVDNRELLHGTPWLDTSSPECYGSAQCAAAVKSADLNVDIGDLEKTLLVARNIAL